MQLLFPIFLVVMVCLLTHLLRDGFGSLSAEELASAGELLLSGHAFTANGELTWGQQRPASGASLWGSQAAGARRRWVPESQLLLPISTS